MVIVGKSKQDLKVHKTISVSFLVKCVHGFLNMRCLFLFVCQNAGTAPSDGFSQPATYAQNGCESMCTSILLQQQSAAFNIYAAIILIIHYYLNISQFFSLCVQKSSWDDHRERKGKVPYLSLFRISAPSSSTISAPLLQPFLWRVWREQGTQMEDRSSERGKHKRTQGRMGGGRRGWRRWWGRKKSRWETACMIWNIKKE